jgi:hypothetical protein
MQVGLVVKVQLNRETKQVQSSDNHLSGQIPPRVVWNGIVTYQSDIRVEAAFTRHHARPNAAHEAGGLWFWVLR